ncbi:hypothetical protein V8C35DRAFT_313158 [Trichoderma chlorosporum]
MYQTETISTANTHPSCCVAEDYAAASTQPSLSLSRNPALKSLEDIQCIVEKLQRTQLLQEQSIKELERRLESRCGRIAEFPSFSRLPPELRLHIWGLALPVQIFRPFRYLQPSFLEWTSVAPPVISRVCREARYVAHKNGALYYHEFLAPYSWTWFNGRNDILDLSPYHIVEDGYISVQRSLLRETRNLLLNVNYVDDRVIHGLFGKDGCLPNVRTIYLMAGNAFQAEKQSWHPHAVARLFGDQSFAHVDIEDDAEVERLEQLLIEMASASDGSFIDKFHRYSIAWLRAQIRPSATVIEPWKKVKQLLMQGWMSYNVGTPPSDVYRSCVEGGGMIKEDEVRKLYPQMPVIKLVQTFELVPMQKMSTWCRRQSMEDVRG